MKSSRAFLGVTGSILVLMHAVALVFFRQEIFPSSAGADNPDSLILLVSGLPGLFGGLIGIAGSVLAFKDPELSCIMLLGAAVSGAVMFSGLFVIFHLVYLIWLDRYVTLAAGIIAFIFLVISGVFPLISERESNLEPGN